MRIRFAMSLGALGILLGASQIDQAPVPALERGRVVLPDWQEHAQMPGHVRIAVNAKDGVAANVKILEAEPIQYGATIESLIKQWRFQRDWQGQFEVAFRFIVDSKNWTCVAARNPTVSVRVPTEVQISVPEFRICDETQSVVETGLVTRTLEGIVRCECDNRRPIPGAVIHITPESAETPGEERRRNATTAPDGRFRVDNLPDGRYHIDVAAKGFRSKGFLVRINQERTKAQPVEWLLSYESPSLPRPVTTVGEADLPVFPVAAVASGTDGVVKLRVSTVGNSILDVETESGPPLLAKAAADNVRTWLLRRTSVSVLHVTFTYKLIPGDCGPDQQPLVTMRFPTEVELTAKRIVKCGF